MTRTHPIILDDGRIIVPLYSDGFSFSLMAISDDGGETWHTSEPLVGAGNIQPALAARRDGTVVAFMRDNGPAPKRIPVSGRRTAARPGARCPMRRCPIPAPASTWWC